MMQQTGIKLSKGVYQLIKDHLKRDQKLSDFNKEKLISELKTAEILPAKSLPETVVAVNTKIQVREVDTEQEYKFELVTPDKVKLKSNKISVLSPIGLALIGYREGQEVSWEMPDGVRTYRIERVICLRGG